MVRVSVTRGFRMKDKNERLSFPPKTMSINNIYSCKKRTAFRDSCFVNAKHRRLGIEIPQPAGLPPFPTPSIVDEYTNTSQTLLNGEDDECKPIDAVEASTILRSFVTRSSKKEDSSHSNSDASVAAPLSLYLPLPNPKWRISMDSPDSLPSFLIPSPRSSTRSDASDLSYIAHLPKKSLSALLVKESANLIASNYAGSLSIKESQIRTGD
jgi:hypothetical protein